MIFSKPILDHDFTISKPIISVLVHSLVSSQALRPQIPFENKAGGPSLGAWALLMVNSQPWWSIVMVNDAMAVGSDG